MLPGKWHKESHMLGLSLKDPPSVPAVGIGLGQLGSKAASQTKASLI